MSAEGGADVALEIWASGVATLDFASMKDLHAKSGGFGFDFRYSGSGNATLSTPSPGTLHSENADYSAIKVSASVKLARVGEVPLLRDTPLSELVKMMEGVAGQLGHAGSAGSAAPPPQAPVRGIDSAPVFASTQYTCAGDALTIRGAEQRMEWTFKRQP